ncbi:acyl-CoA synthetase [Zavarzinia sp. CC-PAN008]|uniref:acyl-CoA synthetase n=1 Tax=Zavarzinia sp. CC-PAN008 TaxID=3243332 RepID=UPI003F742104
MAWNYGDILDAVAKTVDPRQPALIHGDLVIDWQTMDARTNALARGLIAKGHQPQDKLAILIRNRPEYMEATVAGFKGRFVHVNVNYRYKAHELHYIFDNSDAAIVVYGSEFADLVTELQPRLPLVKTWLQVKVDGTPLPPFATDYEAFVAAHDGAPLGNERSPDDMLFLYTGGTTGMPKGVMWRQDDLRQVQMNALLMPKIPTNVDEHCEMIREQGPGSRMIPACPQMHGTGLLTSFNTLAMGGCVVTLEAMNFDTVELWDTVQKHKVQQVVIVGDAFAKPMLRILDANPGKWDLSSLVTMVSSGVMWSQEVKHGLLEHIPQLTMMDSFGSSEAVGFGLAVTTKEGEVQTAKFAMGEEVRVFTPDHKPVNPGDPEPGFIARGGNIPMGYWKDPEKTAKTFPVIDGKRWSIPGDWCRVHEDGTITLLGRGSVCINTAGEKVYPEEVEEVLKQHPDVDDALVVGVPDERWGSAVTGVVELRPGAKFDEETLRLHVRNNLAGYKTPKRILAVERLFRAPNGKADYKGTTDYARSALGL